MPVKIRIAEAEDFSQDVIEHLKQFAQVDVAPCKQEELEQIFKKYDVFWFRLGFRIGASLIENNNRCKIVL